MGALNKEVGMTGKEAARLGELFARARAKQGLSLRALEERTGLAYVWIQRLEQGDYVHPSADRLTRLAEALGIDPARINRISRGEVAERLPGMKVYFRAKYDLSPEEVDEVEKFVKELQKGGDHDNDNTDNAADL